MKNFLFAYQNRKLLNHYNLNPSRFSLDKVPSYRPTSWLDLPDAPQKIQEKVQKGFLTPEEGSKLLQFFQEGYLILENAVDPKRIDFINAEILKAVDQGKIAGVKNAPESLENSRALDLHEKIPALKELFEHPTSLHWMKLIFDRKVIPFQSLNFFYSSQQSAHSDAIHMTTYPLGFMAATWTALEDVHEDSGPLFYYPGSHRLPYVFSRDCGIEGEEYVTEGRGAYSDKYETYIQGVIESQKLKAQFFLPKKGDVLIWHHNLLHGGSQRKDPTKTRKSFVCHYFSEGVLCYHDLINEYAKIKENPR